MEAIIICSCGILLWGCNAFTGRRSKSILKMAKMIEDKAIFDDNMKVLANRGVKCE